MNKTTKKIAYNYLFTDGHINECTLEQTLKHLEMNRTKHEQKKQNVEKIAECIKLNFDNYVKNWFIAGSYEELYTRLI